MNTVTVDVAPWYTSKIVWTQVIGLAAVVASVFGFNLDPATQVQLVSGIVTVVAIATTIFKVFFTKTVTPSSAAKV